MKSSRFKYQYNKSASKLHKLMGEILHQPPWNHYRIYQEYPVNKINPKFKSGREHFDWYVKDLNLVIELMGQQHEKPATFGGISKLQAKFDLIKRVKKDMSKKEAAEESGCIYIAIWYDEEVTAELLWEKYEEAKCSKPLP